MWHDIETAPNEGRLLLWLPACRYGRSTMVVRDIEEERQEVRKASHWWDFGGGSITPPEPR